VRRGSWLAPGLLLGTAIDALVADPHAAHPVAAFSSLAARAENLGWADVRERG
jgi:adenosylcobinamide-phosphate synthase